MVGVIKAAIGQAARLRLLSDRLLSFLDQEDAEEDNAGGKELSCALDGHKDGPVRGILVN